MRGRVVIHCYGSTWLLGTIECKLTIFFLCLFLLPRLLFVFHTAIDTAIPLFIYVSIAANGDRPCAGTF